MRAFAATAVGTVRQRLARHPLDPAAQRQARASAARAGGTGPQRLARPPLDRAAERQAGADLVAPVGQQELADAVGTARGVVARTLRGMRGDGLVRTGRFGVGLLDPARLHAEV